MCQLTLYDVVGHALQGLGDVGEEAGFLALIEQVEMRPRLNVVIVAFAVVVPIGITGYIQRRLGKFGTFYRPVERFWLVVGVRIREVWKKSHMPILVIGVNRAFGRVDGQRFIIVS